MKKDDLSTGMVLTMRNGDSFIALLECDDSDYPKDLLICLEDGEQFTAMALEEYDDTLTYVGEGFKWDLDSEFDITKVSVVDFVGDVFREFFGTGNTEELKVIWEREDDGFDS